MVRVRVKVQLGLDLGLGRYILCVDNEFRVRGLILEGLTKSHKVSSLMRLSISRLPSRAREAFASRAPSMVVPCH